MFLPSWIPKRHISKKLPLSQMKSRKKWRLGSYWVNFQNLGILLSLWIARVTPYLIWLQKFVMKIYDDNLKILLHQWLWLLQSIGHKNGHITIVTSLDLTITQHGGGFKLVSMYCKKEGHTERVCRFKLFTENKKQPQANNVIVDDKSDDRSKYYSESKDDYDDVP